MPRCIKFLCLGVAATNNNRKNQMGKTFDHEENHMRKKKKKQLETETQPQLVIQTTFSDGFYIFFIQVVHDSQKQMAHFTSLNDFKDVEIYSKGF